MNKKFNLYKQAKMIKMFANLIPFLNEEEEIFLLDKVKDFNLEQGNLLGKFTKELSQQYEAGQISEKEGFQLILAKIEELQALSTQIAPEPQVAAPVPEQEITEETPEVPEDFWAGKLISEPNFSGFKQKLIEYKDLNIVPRRAGGRVPAGYNRDETFSDYSKQSMNFIRKDPTVRNDILSIVAGEDWRNRRNITNVKDAVDQAMERSFSPSFYEVSYMKNGKKIREIEDHNDGRISFILSSPKIFGVFNNRFKQATGDDLVKRLNENGITEINDVTLGKVASYNIVAQTLKQYPNNGLAEFIDALIDKKYELMKKWVARIARSILSGEYYEGFRTRGLTVETDKGKFDLPGRSIAGEGRKMTVEQMEEERQSVKDFMMNKFDGLKSIAKRVVEKMEEAGDAGKTSKYFKAEILQNLIKTYQKQLESIFDSGNLTSLKDMIELRSTGPLSGYIKMNLDPEKMREVDFRKMITGFRGRKGRQEEQSMDTNVVDSFNESVKAKTAFIHALRNEFKRSHSKKFIAEQSGISMEQLNYLLSTGLQDIKTLYSTPTEEEYNTMLEERRAIRGRLADYVEANPEVTAESVKPKMILDILNNDFTGALKDKEIASLVKDVRKQGAESYKASLVPDSPEEVKQKYNKMFKQKELYKKIIGDTLRWDMANWVETLLEMVESGETDYDSMNLFLSFINPHRTIREGRRYPKATPALWRLYGFEKFEDLPPDIQEELSRNGITSLPEPTKKLSMSEKMVLFAFNRAENKIRKLWHMKQSLTKTAGTTVIDSKIKQIAADALVEIRMYRI